MLPEDNIYNIEVSFVQEPVPQIFDFDTRRY